MNYIKLLLLLATLALTGCHQIANRQGDAMDMKLAHMVFFDLTDNSQAKADELVNECYAYLKDHDGVVYFSAGTRATELVRPVNDNTFSVALHVVFASKADHDRYQTAPEHLEFIDRNKANWAKVRVFDSYVK